MAKAKKKDDIPNLDNATPEFLIDEIERVRDEQKPLKKLEGIYKEALKARLPENQNAVEGEFYAGIISEEERTGLDTAKIRKDMDDDWIQEHSTTSTYAKISTVKKTPVNADT